MNTEDGRRRTPLAPPLSGNGTVAETESEEWCVLWAEARLYAYATPCSDRDPLHRALSCVVSSGYSKAERSRTNAGADATTKRAERSIGSMPAKTLDRYFLFPKQKKTHRQRTHLFYPNKMRLSLLVAGIVACLLAVVAAWSKEDHEIFRLRDEVEATEGTDVTFYDFLGVKPSANQEDINVAYRKKSRVLHPDKVKQKFITDKSTGKDKPKSSKTKPGVHVSKGPSQAEIKAATEAASDRFARLGLVTNILRGSQRARYDHFLSNGFPKWKGTGYYYARFRPGIGTVLAGLFIFVGGGGHWLALYMSWKRQQEFVGRYVKFARQAAWGDNLGIPGLDGTATSPATSNDSDSMAQPMNRRQRRMQEKDSKKDKSERKTKGIKANKASPIGTPPVGASGPKKRVVAENGKILVVDVAGNVYLEQADEDGETHEFLLDPNELHQPTIKDTALVRVPIWAFNRAMGRFLNRAPVEEEEEEEEEEGGDVTSGSSGADDFEVLEKVKTTAENGTGKAIRRNKKNVRR
ncbi:hypothetical protein B7494_g2904 [Chlorociboria aeruginascens]|nr:hypothetical protein B7494_g2904 [Chlorociboria aeruginascens]